MHFSSFYKIFTVGTLLFTGLSTGFLISCSKHSTRSSADTSASLTLDADSLKVTATAETSAQVEWSAATSANSAQATLEYAVIAASDETDFSTADEFNAALQTKILPVAFLLPWTANIQKATLTGLSASSHYFVTVAVRDSAQGFATYTQTEFTTLDKFAPIPGSIITFSALTDSGFKVSWGAATGDSTTSLTYRVVLAASTDLINSVAKAQAISGSNLLHDYTPSSLSFEATGLSEGTTYAIGVLVKDDSGLVSLYPPQQVKTLDFSAPTPGNSLILTNVTTTGLRVTVDAASDSSPSVLQYRFVKASAAASIDTIAEALAVPLADVVANWSTVRVVNVTGLSPNTTYAFAVLVRDDAGNTALYSPQQTTTLDNALRIFLTSSNYTGSTLGGVSGADALCHSDSIYPGSGTFKALLVSATRRACSSANCTAGVSENLDWVMKPNTVYKTLGGGVIATTSTAGIFVFPLNVGVASGFSKAWTGLNIDWTSNSNTCTNWTANAGTSSYGFANQTSNLFLQDSSDQSCASGATGLYCVEQ